MLLERRLDNMIYRLGFATTHAEARQLVRHGHFQVNGKSVNIPSLSGAAGRHGRVSEKSRKVDAINERLSAVDRRGVPTWLELEKEEFTGKVRTCPSREELTMPDPASS